MQPREALSLPGQLDDQPERGPPGLAEFWLARAHQLKEMEQRDFWAAHPRLD